MTLESGLLVTIATKVSNGVFHEFYAFLATVADMEDQATRSNATIVLVVVLLTIRVVPVPIGSKCDVLAYSNWSLCAYRVCLIL